MSYVHINPATHSVSGSEAGGHFCGYPDVGTVYFYAVFDKPFKSLGYKFRFKVFKQEMAL